MSGLNYSPSTKAKPGSHGGESVDLAWGVSYHGVKWRRGDFRPVKVYIGGQWIDKSGKVPVINPHDGSEVDGVPREDAGDVEAAIFNAVACASVMANTPGYEQYTILRKASELVAERQEEFAHATTLEEGKTLAEARTEVLRTIQTMTLSSEES